MKKIPGALNLRRVSAPLFVDPKSGLNDNLNGVEPPVWFDIPGADCDGESFTPGQVETSALYRYEFKTGKGLYTDMNAIRHVKSWIISILFMLINGTGKSHHPGAAHTGLFKRNGSRYCRPYLSHVVYSTLEISFNSRCRRPPRHFHYYQELEDLYPN